MEAAAYPVWFAVQRPQRFEKSHVFLRLLILIVIAVVLAFAWVLALLYLVLPVVAAALISRDGDRFQQEGAAQIRRVLHWIVAFDAYLSLLTDRMPIAEGSIADEPTNPGAARFDVRFTGSPTVGSALMRLLTSIPSAVVLAVLGFAATVTGIVAAVFVLISEDYPDGLYCFHTGVVRWFARLLAYHGSLVDEYPPFGLDTSTEGSPPLATPGPTA